MGVVDTFGNYVERLCESGHTGAAKWLLKTGWRLQGFRFTHFPDKRLSPADRYLAGFMMRSMTAPLLDADNSVMVGIFVPCEIFMEAGLHPYNVEGFSSYLTGSSAEGACIRCAESMGIPDTLCSYHRTLIGAGGFNILPRPRFIAYTNIVCDANMLSFKHLKNSFDVPSYFIDVPEEQSEYALDHVEEQIRGLLYFVKELTGRSIDEGALRARVERSRRSMEKYIEYLKLRSDRYIAADVTGPMYIALSNNIFLGSSQEEHFVSLLLQDAKSAPPKRGKHIYFMHTIPIWSKALRERLFFREEAQIVSDELAWFCDPDYDTYNPYRAMAYRMVYHHANGPITRRIEMGIKKASLCKADGVIWFNHWGCKQTLGGSAIAKRMFEEAGYKTLVLDGDGCDSGFGGEGQTATRLGAFMEMLENR